MTATTWTSTMDARCLVPQVPMLHRSVSQHRGPSLLSLMDERYIESGSQPSQHRPRPLSLVTTMPPTSQETSSLLDNAIKNATTVASSISAINSAIDTPTPAPATISTGIYEGIIVAIVVPLLAACLIYYYCTKRRQRRRAGKHPAPNTKQDMIQMSANIRSTGASNQRSEDVKMPNRAYVERSRSHMSKYPGVSIESGDDDYQALVERR